MSILRQRSSDHQGPAGLPVRWPRSEPAVLTAAPMDGTPVRVEDELPAEVTSYNEGELKSLPTRSKSKVGRGLQIIAGVALLGLLSAVAAVLLATFSAHVSPNTKTADAPSTTVGPFGSLAATREFASAQVPADTEVSEARATNEAAALSTPPPAAANEPAPATNPVVRGVTEKEILFGISAPFSGSAKELGRQMKLGIETAFNMANDSGGVYGRSLRLVAADDGYEPTRTIEVMKQLYEKDQVFGVIGNVGTPTAMVSVPYALEHKMLFFGAFSGAGLLRQDPPDRYVFNYRASYAEETDAVVHYLVKVQRLRPEQIAVFAQQDSYGDAGFAGVTKAIRALRGGDQRKILRLNYKRNTVDVDDALANLRAHRIGIKAVVMVATYRAAAKFIEKTRDLYPTMIYTNVSFVGSTALADELMLLGPHYADGIIVTQVVPAIDSYATKILEYKSALAKYFPGETPDYVSLEGYVTASLLIEVLKRTGPQLDTEKLVNQLEGVHALDMGLGTVLNFGLAEHQGSHKVWGTRLDATGHYQAVDLQ